MLNGLAIMSATSFTIFGPKPSEPGDLALLIFIFSLELPAHRLIQETYY
jgi:hypothetical protein